jgi:hypothetical protein
VNGSPDDILGQLTAYQRQLLMERAKRQLLIVRPHFRLSPSTVQKKMLEILQKDAKHGSGNKPV